MLRNHESRPSFPQTGRKLVLLAFIFGLCASATPFPTDDGTLPALTAIAGQGMMNDHAYQALEELSDQIGGRVTGSPQAQRAIEWGVEKMKAIGLEDVHVEKWQMAHGWKRISARRSCWPRFTAG